MRPKIYIKLNYIILYYIIFYAVMLCYVMLYYIISMIVLISSPNRQLVTLCKRKIVCLVWCSCNLIHLICKLIYRALQREK